MMHQREGSYPKKNGRNCGLCHKESETIFHYSSTCWMEGIGSAVGSFGDNSQPQTLQRFERLIETGRRVQSGWRSPAGHYGLKISTSGIAPVAYFPFEYENGQAIQTLFTHEMVQKRIPD